MRWLPSLTIGADIMLGRTQLEDLYREYRAKDVLSVYVDGGQHDPAARAVWHTAFERGMALQRRVLEDRGGAEIDAFDAARDLIEANLPDVRSFLPDRGWVAFATAHELLHAGGSSVPMPDLVRWERGLRVAPYVRALKQERVVVAAVADRRKARIFTYRDGEVVEFAGMVADRDHGDVAESTSSKRASPTSGARGETGADRGQRARDVSALRLQEEIVTKLGTLAGSSGFVVLGGTPEVVSALASRTSDLGPRRMERPSMHIDMTLAQVKEELEDGASELTRGVQAALLGQVVDAARSGGKGTLGIQATKEALREGRVDVLLVSRGLREQEGDLVDHFVGGAFEFGAGVEELSGASADQLDQEGEGVGARLRYTT